MNIDKSQIIEFLRSRGQQDKADQADRELPQQVDTDKDRGLLDKVGIDVQDLIAKLTSGGVGDLGKKFGL